jgi:hypothetical protein
LGFGACLACVALLLALGACGEAKPPSHEDIVRKDLAAIIDLQGSPCGQVVAFEMDRQLDYRVECETGHVYRIHVSPEGHVNLSKHAEQ